MLGDLKSSPIEELRGRAASVEQGPVKLSVQTFGLLLTPTLAGLVPALSPALLHPAAHTCPDSTMMMYFWVSTAPLKCGYLLLLTPLRYAQSWRVERVWRMCQSVLQPLHYIQCEFERVCVCVWCSASHMHEQSWWFFHSRVFYWCWVAAARSYRGLCLPVTFVQPLNEIGCLGAIVIHANTFTSSSTSPPPDCQTTQHAAETVSLRLRTTLGVFRGHVVISSPALCFQRFLCDIVVFLAYISKSGRIS